MEGRVKNVDEAVSYNFHSSSRVRETLMAGTVRHIPVDVLEI